MTEQVKAEHLAGGPGYDGCYAPRKGWWQPGWPVAASYTGCSSAPSWLGVYAPAPSPLFVPSCVMQGSSSSHSSSMEQYKWRVILDMTHFTPSEVSVSVQEGFLVIGGSHPERPDVFGITARCFTRKYRLPVGIDVSELTSSMSGDGILCVEAPLPDTSTIPADIVIPIQVERETSGGHEMRECHKQAAPETHTENGEARPSEPTAPEHPPTEPEPEPSTEAPDQAGEDSLPPAASNDHKQEEEEAPAGAEVSDVLPSGDRPRPLAPADEEGAERFPEPSEHSEGEATPQDSHGDKMEEMDAASPLPSPMEQQVEEISNPETAETQPTAPPVLSDEPAAAEEASPLEEDHHGEDSEAPGSTPVDLQEHGDESTEKDSPETLHAEPTEEQPHPLSEESLPDPPPPPPEHGEEDLDGRDSPDEPTSGGKIQSEEITLQQQQHEEPELVKGMPTDGLSQEPLDLEAPAVKQ